MLNAQERQTWRGRITQAESFQKRNHSRWKDSLDWLNLRYLSQKLGDSAKDWTEVHWLWNYYNTLIPTLYAKDPNVIVKARRKISFPFSATLQDVLTYDNDELGMKDCVQLAIADSVPYGSGYVEVGYEPTVDEIKALNSKRADAEERHTLKAQIKKKLIAALGPEETPAPTLSSTLRGGSPYLRWIPAWRVFLCPGYHLLKEMPWVIVAEDVEKEDLLRNPRYRKGDIENLKATRRISTSSEMVKTTNPVFSQRGSADLELIRLWHVYDRRNLRYMVFPDGAQDEILDWPWLVSTNEFLLKELRFNRLPPSESDAATYAMDDVTPLKPQLLEKSWLRSDMVKARRRSAPLIYMQKTANSEKEAKRLQEAGIANIVLLQDISPNAIRGDNPVKIPDDTFRVDGTIDNDLNTVSGYSQVILSGSPQSGVDTATEANIAQSGMTLRGSRKTDIVEEFIRDIDRSLALIRWEKTDRDEISAMLGYPVSEEMWPDVSTLNRTEKIDKMSRELDFKIEAHSTQPDQIKLVEQNIAIRNTNMIKAAFPNVIDEAKLLRYHMKKMGDKEFEYTMKPETDVSQQEAMGENQLLAQGHPVPAHQGDRHDVHIPIHGQQANLMAQQGLDTLALDNHIQMHAQLMQVSMPQPGTAPQKGDTNSPAQAVVPEMQRQGVEKFPDLAGQSSNLYANTGSEAPSGL